MDELINEVVQTPGALPLLSFTQSELYRMLIDRHDDSRAMTGADYRSLGGVAGSLRNRVNEEYQSLDPDRQATMRRILLRMIATERGRAGRRSAYKART